MNTYAFPGVTDFINISTSLKVHVVIPCYNHWELTHARLWELYNLERDNIYSVLVVNDGSTDNETEKGIDWWNNCAMRGIFGVQALHLNPNVGFLKASNLGIGTLMRTYVPPEDVIILLSNDVQIKSKFISQICAILEPRKAIVGGKLLAHDTGWNNFGGKIYPYLEGWLLAARACAWDELGGFDERYAPQDFEDVDFSTMAIEEGYELVPLNNPGIYHLGAQTYGYNLEREANTINNKDKFEEKWITHNLEKK